MIAGLANARPKGKRSGRPPLADYLYEKAKHLWRQGLSFRKIGHELDLDEGIIRKCIKLDVKPIRDIILSTQLQNLLLSPSHIRLDKVEQQLTPELFRETFLHQAMANLDYDFILINCHPTLGMLTILDNSVSLCPRGRGGEIRENHKLGGEIGSQ